MAYRILGLDQERFRDLIGVSDETLARHGARRVVADPGTGFPCRAALEDAGEGDSLILLNFTSHDVPGPFRTSHAIFVCDYPSASARHIDEIPDALERRAPSLRGFDQAGMLIPPRPDVFSLGWKGRDHGHI